MRLLDEVNDQGLLAGGGCQGKYDVSRPRIADPRKLDTRMLEAGAGETTPGDSRLLDAA